MEGKNQKLYLFQFIATIGIVVIHVGRIVENPSVHFLIKNLICRVAVPFFFINNAFFYRSNEQKKGYSKRWLKKIVCIYSLAFIVYIPFGIKLLQQTLSMDWKLLPFVIIVGYFYSGSFYHLWYFPALIVSLFMVKSLLKKIGYLKTFSLCILLFGIGSLETYSGFIKDPFLLTMMDRYFRLFLTTRNGLFFSPIFILFGYFLADNKNKLVNWRNQFKFGGYISLILATLEGIIIYQNQGIDKNFMYFTLVCSISLFGLLITSESNWKGCEQLKKYSLGIFLFHMIPIQLFNNWNVENTGINGFQRTLLGVFVPVFLIFIFELVNKYIFEIKFMKFKKS